MKQYCSEIFFSVSLGLWKTDTQFPGGNPSSFYGPGCHVQHRFLSTSVYFRASGIDIYTKTYAHVPYSVIDVDRRNYGSKAENV
jgi:hypothetical protein